MIERIKIEITEAEWLNAGADTRQRILELMNEQGYDPGMLGELEEKNRDYSPDEIFKQFYEEDEG